MSTLIQAIEELLRPEVIQKGPLALEELDKGSSCKAITLHKSGYVLALKPDLIGGKACSRPDCSLGFSSNDRLFPLFRSNVAGYTAMCDYILFCSLPEKDKHLFVLLCELKSGNAGSSQKQIENGRILADYILTMAKHHGALVSMPEIEFRGLVFGTHPSYSVPKGNLRKVKCQYMPSSKGFPDMKFAHYPCGTGYPLSHFCV